MLRECYGHDVPLELADAELRLDPAHANLPSSPHFYWTQRGAHLVVFKAAQDRYRNQFFCSSNTVPAAPIMRDIGECVGVLSRLQADHEKRTCRRQIGCCGRTKFEPRTLD